MTRACCRQGTWRRAGYFKVVFRERAWVGRSDLLYGQIKVVILPHRIA